MVKWRVMLHKVMLRLARLQLVMHRAKDNKAMIGLVRMVLETIDLDETADTIVLDHDHRGTGKVTRTAAVHRTAREMANDMTKTMKNDMTKTMKMTNKG